MYNVDELMDIFSQNIKKLFFPEEWISLDLKFSKSEIFTMLLLDKKKEITMTELAENINAPMSTATGIADRLVKNAYMKRERSEQDRRIVVLRLTDKGKEFINDIKCTVSKYINLVMDNLTEEERDFLIKIIFKAIDIVRSQHDILTSNNAGNEKVKKINIE